jgi:RHS repeat-associated protein
LVDATGDVKLARAYQPYGGTLSEAGTGSTIFQFAGEQQDHTGLLFLRARYYSAVQGRFLNRDVWQGDPERPSSYNGWEYGRSNPVRYTDPTGKYWEVRECELYPTEEERQDCHTRAVETWEFRFREPPYIEWTPRNSLSLLTPV